MVQRNRDPTPNSLPQRFPWKSTPHAQTPRRGWGGCRGRFQKAKRMSPRRPPCPRRPSIWAQTGTCWPSIRGTARPTPVVGSGTDRQTPAFDAASDTLRAAAVRIAIAAHRLNSPARSLAQPARMDRPHPRNHCRWAWRQALSPPASCPDPARRMTWPGNPYQALQLVVPPGWAPRTGRWMRPWRRPTAGATTPLPCPMKKS